MARVGPAPEVINMQPTSSFQSQSKHGVDAVIDYVRVPVDHRVHTLAPHSSIAITRPYDCKIITYAIEDESKSQRLGSCTEDNCFGVACEAIDISLGGSAMKVSSPTCEFFCCKDKVIMYIKSPSEQTIGSFAVRKGCGGMEYFIKDTSENIAFRFQPQCCYCCPGDFTCDMCRKPAKCDSCCCACCCDRTAYIKVLDSEGEYEVAYIRRIYSAFCSWDCSRRYFVDYLRPNEPVGNKALIMATALIIDYYDMFPLMGEHQFREGV